MDVDVVAVGRRIKAERERAGLSQRELAAAAGLSQATLHRIERGTRAAVTVAEIDALAGALEVRLTKLLQGSPVQARVLAAARTEPDVDMATVAGPAVEVLEIDDRLDRLVGDSGRQRPRTVDFVVATAADAAQAGRQAAENVRRHLQLGLSPIADVETIIEELTGIDVAALPLGADVSGLVLTDPERATTLVVINSDDTRTRQRFTAAHELAHVLFGDGTTLDLVDSKRTAAEDRCDEFARHLLAPPQAVQAWLNRHVDTGTTVVNERLAARAAWYFGVSLKPMLIQLAALDRADDPHTEQLPTGEHLANRYGWASEFAAAEGAAKQARPPRRVVERATAAYQQAKLGVRVLAQLERRPVYQVEASLAEAGITAAPRRRRRVRLQDLSAPVATVPVGS